MTEAAMEDLAPFAGEWRLEAFGGAGRSVRESEDFSPLDFWQRYTGRFSSDGWMITGAWEMAHGEAWEKDFDLAYTRIG